MSSTEIILDQNYIFGSPDTVKSHIGYAINPRQHMQFVKSVGVDPDKLDAAVGDLTDDQEFAILKDMTEFLEEPSEFIARSVISYAENPDNRARIILAAPSLPQRFATLAATAIRDRFDVSVLGIGSITERDKEKGISLPHGFSALSVLRFARLHATNVVFVGRRSGGILRTGVNVVNEQFSEGADHTITTSSPIGHLPQPRTSYIYWRNNGPGQAGWVRTTSEATRAYGTDYTSGPFTAFIDAIHELKA